MSEPSPGALSPGQIFHGRYEIVRCLRAGGMGAVYECIHLKTRKRRALKVMLPQILANSAMRDRFELEARVTAEIESEHIVETFDAGVDEATGAPFLVMELLRGEDLASVLKRRGALPASEVIVLLAQAGLALDKTHAAGIVHRDLKPDNLYVTTRDDGSPRLKILDFGIAKVVADVNQTVQQTATIGTPLYMSQEQILGDGTIGPRSDVYALGHIAFALLTGAAYWADEQRASPSLYVFLGTVMAGALEPAAARAARRGVALTPAFDAWFARATARSASDRFEGASVLVRELASVLEVAAPRAASLPAVPTDSLGSVAAPEVPAAPLNQPAHMVGPIDTPTPTVGEGTTLLARNKAIGAAPTRSRLLVVVAGLGAIGLLVVGLKSRSANPTASPPMMPTVAASSPTGAMSAVEPAPTSLPSPAPEAVASAVVPVASAAVTGPDSASTSTLIAEPSPTSSTAVGAVIAPPPPSRPKPAPAKSVTHAKDCDDPYFTNSAGHRAVKPQCL
jgi:serine/threonine-protein kinase